MDRPTTASSPAQSASARLRRYLLFLGVSRHNPCSTIAVRQPPSTELLSSMMVSSRSRKIARGKLSAIGSRFPRDGYTVFRAVSRRGSHLDFEVWSQVSTQRIANALELLD